MYVERECTGPLSPGKGNIVVSPIPFICEFEFNSSSTQFDLRFHSINPPVPCPGGRDSRTPSEGLTLGQLVAWNEIVSGPPASRYSFIMAMRKTTAVVGLVKSVP